MDYKQIKSFINVWKNNKNKEHFCLWYQLLNRIEKDL